MKKNNYIKVLRVNLAKARQSRNLPCNRHCNLHNYNRLI
jgi:hypothetical protein